MSEHPPAFRLDAHVAGDLDPSVTEHLAACDACTAYIAATTAAAARFAGTEGKKAADFVLALDDRARARARAEARPRWIAKVPRAAWVAAPLLAAAALLFLVRMPTTPLVPAVTEPAVRFKGKMQVAVVRDRNGDQSRIATEVRVRPGDRLRVEVSIDEARSIEVGFLGKDGTWVLLLAPAFIEAGTHFSERAARFDDMPTEGWIIAGIPDDVSRARSRREGFEDVSVIPVIAEP
jgi:hypothetical protein